MFKTNIYILENDNDYRNKIKNIIKRYPSDRISFTFPLPHNYLDFIQQIPTKDIADTDIFFLDIDLQTNFTGIDIAKIIREKNSHCPIIFLTRLTNQAITIINESIHAKRYLVKEIDSKLLKEHIFDLLLELEQTLLPRQDDTDVLTLATRNETMFYNYSDILYIESVKGSRGKIMVKTLNQNQLINWRIGNIKKHIDKKYMLTSLQSFVINLENIQGFNRSVNAIIFKNSEQLLVGLKVFNKIFQATKEYRDDSI